MLHRSLPPLVLLAPMAVLTMVVGLGSGHWWLLALMLIPCGALCAPTIAASSDAISRLIPAAARGEAMGLHNSALTVGVALGGPLAGFAADTYSPQWGFAAVGGAGVLIALLVLPAELRRRRAPAVPLVPHDLATMTPAPAAPHQGAGAATDFRAPAGHS
jgi:MFS family permease